MNTLMSNPAIAEAICKLDKYVDSPCSVDQIEFIKNRLFDALGARFDSREDLENYVWQDCDPFNRIQTEDINEYDGIWQDVRDIQNDIISEFSED